MSLYQKYRPQEFDSLSGQEHVKKTLKNALKRSLIAHAYLFCGPRGTGKTTTARLIAKSLNCPDFNFETGDPCNKCKICKAITNSELIDVIEIDAASNRGIDEIRELKETIRFAPTLAKNKVYIIDEVHMLTNEAFNALLKTLEEPPENVFFILATTEVHKIPETILSRCQRFDFRRISTLDIVERLKFIAKTEKLEYEDEALEIIAIYSDGGLRDSISIMDQLAVSGKVTAEETKMHLGTTGVDTLYKFLEYLETCDDKSAIEIVHSLHEQGSNIKQFENDILKIAREKLHIAIQKNDTKSKQSLLGLIETWQEIHNEFKQSFIPELALEVLIVKVCNKNKFIAPSESMPVLRQPAVPVTTEAKKPVQPVSVPEKVATVAIEKPAPAPVAKPIAREPEAENTKKSVRKSDPVEVVKTEDVASKKVDTSAKLDLTIDLEKDWKKIADKLTVSSLRLMLKNAKFKLISSEEGEIKVTSNFDYERVNKSENIRVVETLINEITGKQIKVNIVKDIIELKTIQTKAKSAEIEKANTPALADMDPFDMFEGQVLE
jgi:DNA polymerase-3 subunit gamma/tau